MSESQTTSLDKLDLRLISLLEIDANQSSEALAAKLKVSPTTVRRHLRRLTRENVFSIVAMVDPQKVGYLLTAIVAFDVANEQMAALMRALSKRPEVKWVTSTTGRFDVMALARFRSTEELSHFVEQGVSGIPGVRNTETSVCLQVAKGRHIS